ncbi:MAG: DNA polymerase III subunit delta [bacterium]
MKNIKKHIKENSFSKVYLVFGKEEFFKNNILNLLTSNILQSNGLEMMNTSIFDDFNNFNNNKLEVQDIINTCNTPPFMSDKRIVIIKNLGLFKDDKKSFCDVLGDYIKDLPEFCILIILEASINKTRKLYKQINKIGSCHDVDEATENDIAKYIISVAKKSNTYIDLNTAMYLISYLGLNINLILSELDKLIFYLKDSGDSGDNNNNRVIDINIINNICAKSVETQVFELVDCIANKNLNTIIEIYRNLLYNKVTPYNILAMIAWQFRVILKVKNASSSNPNQIAKELNMSWYPVKKALTQVKYFSNTQLINALNDCLQTDLNIKTGLAHPELAVEMLMIKYAK